MHHALTLFLVLQALLYPRQTAGIAGCDDGGSGVAEIGDFAFKQLFGECRLSDVIDAGTATAGIGFVEFNQFQAGNLLEQLARLQSYFLPVREVARIVIGHSGVERLGWRNRRIESVC